MGPFTLSMQYKRACAATNQSDTFSQQAVEKDQRCTRPIKKHTHDCLRSHLDLVKTQM